MSDDTEDLESLFDTISAQRNTAAVPAAPVQEGHSSDEKSVDAPEKNPGDGSMFERLGGIVRQLHDSLKELGYDRTLAERAGEIADTKGRLEYIATLTEQAANKVLNAIDLSMPEQDKLCDNAKDLQTSWALLMEGKLSIEAFKTLAGDTQTFMAFVRQTSEAEKSRLMDIMMAQDFQDITGQLIKKVIIITQRLEQDLAQLLRDNAPAALAKEKQPELMSGPDVSGNAMVQDDVDNLLADLGF